MQLFQETINKKLWKNNYMSIKFILNSKIYSDYIYNDIVCWNNSQISNIWYCINNKCYLIPLYNSTDLLTGFDLIFSLSFSIAYYHLIFPLSLSTSILSQIHILFLELNFYFFHFYSLKLLFYFTVGEKKTKRKERIYVNLP